MSLNIKTFSTATSSEVQQKLNAIDNIIYDSIKIRCDSVDNSPSGVIFTVIYKIRK